MSLTFTVPDTLLTTTLHNRRAVLVDNIFKGSAFLSWLAMNNGIRMENGGLELVEPLTVSKNTTAAAFDGYDIIDTTPQSNETSAKFPWRQLAASVSISVVEEHKNKGEGRLIGLLETKSNNASMTLRELLNQQLLGSMPSAGSIDVTSIQELIRDTPSSNPNRTTSNGSISAAANTFWRNITQSGGAFLISDWNAMWNDVSDGSVPPNGILTSSTVYEYYENSLTDQIRYIESRLGNQGFQNLAYKTAPVFWDPFLSVDSAYFLNTEYFKLCVMEGMDFVTTEFVKPDNQMARVAQLAWMGNLTCSNPRRTGVVHSITAPA